MFCACLGQAMRFCRTVSPHRSRGPRSERLDWLVGRPPKRQKGARDAAKPVSDHALRSVGWPSKRRGEPETAEQGVGAPNTGM